MTTLRVRPVAAAAERAQPERRYAGAGNPMTMQAPGLLLDEQVVEGADVQIARAGGGTPAVMRLDDQLERRQTRCLALLHSAQKST